MEFVTVKIKDISNVNMISYSIKEKLKYINYLDTSGIKENFIDHIEKFDLTKDKLPSRARRKAKYNDIIFSLVRPNNLHYGIIKNVLPNFVISTGFAVISINESIADPDYVYFALTRKENIVFLQSIAEQSASTYPSIKPEDIMELNIRLPELNIQKQISKIMNLLNKKIELNNRINDNLCYC